MDYTVAKPPYEDGHAGIIGTTSSGKTSCIVKPTLETWGYPIFAIDVNGELYDHLLELDKPHKLPTKVLNLTNEKGEFSSCDPIRPSTARRRGRFGAKQP